MTNHWKRRLLDLKGMNWLASLLLNLLMVLLLLLLQLRWNRVGHRLLWGWMGSRRCCVISPLLTLFKQLLDLRPQQLGHHLDVLFHQDATLILRQIVRNHVICSIKVPCGRNPTISWASLSASSVNTLNSNWMASFSLCLSLLFLGSSTRRRKSTLSLPLATASSRDTTSTLRPVSSAKNS